MPSSKNLIGETLGGRYQVTEILGQGGMSAVYKAFDPNLQRVVAIKVIHSHLASDPKFVVRFQDEATAVAKLRHPNIVQVYDFNHDDDMYYMVQEFVPGETLQDRLRRLNQAQRRMAIAEAVRYTMQLCNALDYAHQRGLIHRDIKPANIMLDVNGDAILMDFGIVKIVGGQSHTATGAVVGTALYMPPELMREFPGPRSDMYSLGTTLFEMVSGRPPFEADSAMALMMMHINDPVPNLHGLRPEVPDDLIAVIERSLAKNPAERFAGMADLAAALKLVQNRIQTGTYGTAVLPQDGASASQQTIRDDKQTMSDRGVDQGSLPTVRLSGSQPPYTPPPGASGSVGNGGQAYPPGGSRAWQAGAAAAAAGRSGQYGAPPPNDMYPGAQSYESGPQYYGQPQRPAGTVGFPGFTNKRMPILLALGALGLLVGATVICAALIFLPGLRGAAQKPTDAAALILPATNTSTSTSGSTATSVVQRSTDTPAPLPAITDATVAAPAAATEAQATATEAASPTPTIPADIPYSQIKGISLNDKGEYQVDYQTFQFSENLEKLHLIFFFDNQTTAEGYMYGGPRPFIKFASKLRPKNAGQLCIEVANPDHSPRSESGNCYPLPDVVVAAPKDDAQCRSGPGESFSVVTTVKAGEISLVNGVSADEAWWNIVNPQDRTQDCWIPTAQTTTAGDISTVPLAEAPPPSGPSASSSPSATITGITIDNGGNYAVVYTTQGFQEHMPGTHLHFFFDTVSPDQAALGREGDLLMYGGPNPFTGYKTADRPAQATKMCVLVANPNHSIIPNSGNCFPLPAPQSSAIAQPNIARLEDLNAVNVE